jgi:hypothetical protein
MRLRFLHHLIAYVVINVGLVFLNLAPVGFDLHRPGVPLWFVYPLAGWGLLLAAHGVLVLSGVQLVKAGDPGPSVDEPQPRPTPRPEIDPSKAGRAGALLAECRLRAGNVLSALGAVGGVPVDVDDMLRGALDQAEHLTERLAPVYQRLAKGDDLATAQLRDRLEARLESIHVTLEVLRLEAVVLQNDGGEELSTLSGPLEQLREAIMSAAEELATLD